MKKIVFLLFAMLLLNGCFGSIASIIGAGAGNGKLAQRAISSGIQFGIERTTGKSSLEHAVSFAEKHNPDRKKEKCVNFIESSNSEVCAIVKKKVKNVTTKVSDLKNQIKNSSKIKNLN